MAVSRSLLTVTDFTKQAYIDGRLSEILTYEVPRSQVVLLPSDEKLQLMVPAQFEVASDANGTDEYLVGEPIANSAGIVNYGEVSVWDEDAQKYLTVSSVDYGAGKVTVSDATSGNTVHIFYPPASNAAVLRIDLFPPMGHSSFGVPVFMRSFRTTFIVDQTSEYSPVTLRRAGGQMQQLHGGWVVPETWGIHLMVEKYSKPTSGYTAGGTHHGITTSDKADNYVVEIPIQVADKTDFRRRPGEPSLDQQVMMWLAQTRGA